MTGSGVGVRVRVGVAAPEGTHTHYTTLRNYPSAFKDTHSDLHACR